MRKTDNKNSATNIYVVCEGSKSEPWFLRRFIEWTGIRGYAIDYICDIFPTPKDEEPDENGMEAKAIVRKSGRKNSGRRVNNTQEYTDSSETHQGGNPLYWVRHGISKHDAYAEVYVVFDKDGHPKMKEAFELVKTVDNVNIIFNSRSFEYYMLLHFECIYRAFDKTECGEKRGGHTRSFHCCLPDAVKGKECGGKICINGYARLNGYWENSKDENTFYSATNIWRGMANGEFIRTRALNENTDCEVFNLNPYVDFQTLLARLLNMKIFRDEIRIDAGRGEERIISRHGDCMEIANNSSALPMKLENEWLKYYLFPSESSDLEDLKSKIGSEKDRKKEFAGKQGERTIIHVESSHEIQAGESKIISLFQNMQPNSFAILSIDSRRYIIFNNRQLPPPAQRHCSNRMAKPN